MQYKVRKPITVASLMDAGRMDKCFRMNLNIFMNMDLKTKEMDLWEEIDIVDIVSCFRYYPEWEDWLVEKGFIEAEMTFHVGQYFIHPEFPKCLMSITRISDVIVNVIAHQLENSCPGSNRLTMDGMQVDDPRAITASEMWKMTGIRTHELGKIRFCKMGVEPLEVE
jgi:hypothetical protein